MYLDSGKDEEIATEGSVGIYHIPKVNLPTSKDATWEEEVSQESSPKNYCVSGTLRWGELRNHRCSRD